MCCPQAAVFAAKLLALQALGALPAFSGDPRNQVKLYTFGAPRVGNTEFAAYLEENMSERYRCTAQTWLLCLLFWFGVALPGIYL
jgi:predicted lipase